ncbi:hypothetical protein BH23CHL4_BH23CHL4_30410 [soil metagenome]
MERFRIVQNAAGIAGTWVVSEDSSLAFPVAKEALRGLDLSSRTAEAPGVAAEAGLDEVLITMRAPALDPLFATAHKSA